MPNVKLPFLALLTRLLQYGYTYFHLQQNNKVDGLALHNRRGALQHAASSLSIASSTLVTNPPPSHAAATSPPTTTTTILPPTVITGGSNNGLAYKLSKRDPAVLRNSVFNLPPEPQKYPEFLRGTWQVTSEFKGFVFPSHSIQRDRLTADTAIPGFQKCSIAALCDIGRTSTTYQMKISEKTGLEDRSFTLQQSVNAHLGYPAVREVIYDGKNRLSIDFVPNRTRNANRIELFCNGRESELVDMRTPVVVEKTEEVVVERKTEDIEGSDGEESSVASSTNAENDSIASDTDTDTDTDSESDDESSNDSTTIPETTTITTTTTLQKPTSIFVHSEYIRQVTFGLSQEFGVARQVVTNYAHFWTWRQQLDDSNLVRGNLLTAAYLDPQDALYFQEPSRPVAVYSHDLIAVRV